MVIIKTVNALYDFIGYVILSAPESFPIEDYLDDDDQMTLDSAFEQLRAGVKIVYPEDKWVEKHTSLYQLLEQSYTAFKAGDGKAARQLLYDFQNNIFKTDSSPSPVNDS